MANNKTSIQIGTMSIKAAEDLPANRFVNSKGELCKENDYILGATTKSWKQGEIASICFSGIVAVECGDNIFSGGVAVFAKEGGFATNNGVASQNLFCLDGGGAGSHVRVKL